MRLSNGTDWNFMSNLVASILAAGPYALIAALGVVALTFVIGMAKTLAEGTEAIASFDRAGFTLKNFWNGTVPDHSPNESTILTGASAEIEWIDGKLHARPTRTVTKHFS